MRVAYEYPDDDEVMYPWLDEHKKHNVRLGLGNSLICVTCARPLHLPEDVEARRVLFVKFGRAE